MVPLPAVRAENAKFIKNHPLVAVIVGGTAGIGETGVRALTTTHAEHSGVQGLRVYVVGRNASAADKIISDCEKLCSVGKFRFVQAKNLSLLKDVDRVCTEIVRLEEEESADGNGPARVDFLLLTQGFMMLDREETSEGLYNPMSLFYYSRMRCIYNLLPLLTASPVPGHAVTVWHAGAEDKKFYPDDLSLRDPKHFGFRSGMAHVAFMTTFFLEGLVKRNAGKLCCMHVYPGYVPTNFGSNAPLPWWFVWLWRLVLLPLFWPFRISLEESGQRMLYLATEKFPTARQTVGVEKNGGAIAMGTDGKPGSGAYAVSDKGEILTLNEKLYKKFREQGTEAKVWSHTINAFEEIAAGRVFKG